MAVKSQICRSGSGAAAEQRLERLAEILVDTREGFGHLAPAGVVLTHKQHQGPENLFHREDVNERPVELPLLAEHADLRISGFPIQALPVRVGREREQHDLMKVVRLRSSL